MPPPPLQPAAPLFVLGQALQHRSQVPHHFRAAEPLPHGCRLRLCRSLPLASKAAAQQALGLRPAVLWHGQHAQHGGLSSGLRVGMARRGGLQVSWDGSGSTHSTRTTPMQAQHCRISSSTPVIKSSPGTTSCTTVGPLVALRLAATPPEPAGSDRWQQAMLPRRAAKQAISDC